ncbi:MAG: hypothetical protein O2973_01295 [Gemmatimonadetes bacterium]|nr:hypothetical protein [Gemmatimonadota bacterium]
MARNSALRRPTGLVVLTAALVFAPHRSVAAQESGAKPRLELADSARGSARSPDSARADSTPSARTSARTSVALARTSQPPSAAQPPVVGGFRSDFVRNQTLFGVGIYGPALATLIARDGVAWGASYLLVAGGSFVAAAEISRQMTITEPMQHLSTWLPVQGAIAGSMLGSLIDADNRGTAGAVLFGSLGGTAIALWRGREMNEGEAAATVFGTNVLGLAALGAGTAMGLQDRDGGKNKRLALTLGGMIGGAPLGHAYAALASYHVTRGDLTAMTAAAGVGMLAGLTAIADGDDPSDQQLAGALTIGGVLGLVAGDRLLTKRYDHTIGEGRFVVVGALAGGLMGAGVALVARGDDAQWSTLTASLTTAGAAGGILLAQRYAGPKADGVMSLGGLSLNPVGLVAAASGARGTFTLGSIRF